MEEINIKEYFVYLKRFVVAFILVSLLAVTGVAIFDSMIKRPVYQAQTTVVIAKSDAAIEGGAAATLNDVNASQKLVLTYSEIAKSELILNQVIDNLGLNESVKELSRNITIQPVDDTSILSIKTRDYNAKQSATIANEIAKVFSIEVMKIYNIENVKQLSIASVPEAPANNTLTRDIVLAVAISVFAVAGFAFLRFYLDDTLKHSDDIEKEIDLPVTGTILKNDAKHKVGSSELIVEDSPKAVVSENIKSLRTNLQFTAVDEDVKTILITSTNAGEGKSFVSANLAASFAQADKRVLLVDCDLRKGRVHRLFNIPNTSGLSNLLTNDLRGFGRYIRATKNKKLDVITCGTYPPNPSELLSSKKNRRLIKMLCNHYDVVILDGAPIMGLADSVILSSMADETLLVVKDASTNKSDLLEVKDALQKVGAKIAGIVFNMVNRKSIKYYNSYYYNGEVDVKLK